MITGGAGLDFPVWTDDPSVANASANAADISGAKGGGVVMMSGNWYVDYSHGIRLVYRRIKVNKRWMDYTEVLQHPVYKALLCDEDVCDYFRYEQ